MGAAMLSLFLDFVIIVLLGVTIYYALKLSKSLNNFRAHRNEFDKLLDELTRNLGEAQRAIHVLKTTSGDAGKNLQEVMFRSRVLADELQILNQSGEKLAKRLEASRAPQVAPLAPLTEEPDDFEQGRTGFEPDYSRPARKSQFGTDNGPAFSIQDRDFGNLDDDINEDDGDGVPEHLQSQAEKELYSALMQNRKKSTGGRLT